MRTTLPWIYSFDGSFNCGHRRRPLRIVGLALLGAVSPPAQTATLVVPTDFATIQAAIDAAAAQDVVLVEPGTYAENLSLRSNVDVRGAVCFDVSVVVDEASRTSDGDVVIAEDVVRDVDIDRATLNGDCASKEHVVGDVDYGVDADVDGNGG